jgi:uncharacterized protein YmfQ (DUF2313 family)
MSVTFDFTSLSSGGTLSADQLTIGTTTAQSGAFATSPLTSLCYFQMSVTSAEGATTGIGIGQQGFNWSDLSIGDVTTDNYFVLFQGTDGLGDLYSSASATAIATGLGTLDPSPGVAHTPVSVEWCVDLTTNLLWVSVAGGFWNGDPTGDPNAEVAGIDISGIAGTPIYPFAVVSYLDSITADFIDSDPTVPGYTPLDTGGGSFGGGSGSLLSYPTPPTWTQQQFATAFLRLLPTGLAWPGYGQSQMAQSLYPLSGPYADNSALAAALLIDSWPGSTVGLSPEWQQSLGIPGPCLSTYATSQQAQGAIVAQLADNGGCSLGYFQQTCSALGFVVTIQQYAPLRVGMAVGAPVVPDSYAFVWTVTIISGSPASLLYCELTRRLPAHSMLYLIDEYGHVTSPPPILYPKVTATLVSGVCTFAIPTPYMQAAAVNYVGGTHTGTATFGSGVKTVTAAMPGYTGAVTLSAPINLSIT